MQYSNIPGQDIVIKNVTFQDIPKIIELQKESFPSMLEEGSVWGKRHLQSHVEIFPEGQFCVEYENKIIGSSSSLIVKLPSDYEVHTFSQVTGNSLFTTHDPKSDSLYGADISVHPEYRRLGIATLLYKARKDLVIKYTGWTKGKCLMNFALTHPYQHVGEIGVIASLLGVNFE